MVISAAGIIPNISVYHWSHCYLSPWALPEVLILTKAGYLQTAILYPIITAAFIIYYLIY